MISPLLSNFYLHTFDVFVTEKEYGYVRYADDFIILSLSEGEANHAIKDVKWFLENKLKLTINPGSKVAKVQNGFEYLGVLFTDKGVTISKEKMEKLKNKINDSINLHEDKILKKFIETTEGIDRYYARFLSQNILEKLDEWAIVCLKNNINNAYNTGLISKKSEIKVITSGVFFFSDKFKLFKQRELKKITAYCNKKREKLIRNVETPEKDQIKKKKKEYQKLESDGFELIVNTPGVFIGKTKRGISVKKQGVITKNEELKMENEFLDDNTRKRVAEKVLERINGMEISELLTRVILI
ncbi:hypothetical protein HY745_14855 [Candidatus Desantisbacteria bacterium]|nr:hypothetical protein [Candidatus Desantisbacteria bacterium]